MTINDEGLMGAGDEGTETNTTESKDDGAPARPDYMPEQFWDADKGEVNVENLAKGYTSLRAEFNKANKNGKGSVPDAPDGYLEDFEIPRTRGEGDDAQHLDRVKELNSDDPALAAVAAAAHKHGLTTKQFKGLVSDVMFDLNGMMPEPFDMERELDALGAESRDDALRVINVNKTWLDGLRASGTLNEDQYLAARQMGMSALGMQTLNVLREQAGERPIPLNTSIANGGAKTQGELQEMMKDPRYKEDGPAGDAYRAEVERGFQLLAGQRAA